MALLANHCWAEFHTPREEVPRPCLFLDRDGVVILDKDHLKDPDGVEIIRSTIIGMHRARELGLAIGLVTNQSGIGQGKFNWDDFHAVQARIIDQLATDGLKLDFVCACPFHPAGKPPYQAQQHGWRKPEPGMLLHAAQALNLDLQRSLIVGDRATDLEAGRKAGLDRCVLFDGRIYQPQSVAGRSAGEGYASLAALLDDWFSAR